MDVVAAKKRIWIISEIFYPEELSTGYIMTCIADAIAKSNEVQVICGPIGYDKIHTKEEKTFEFNIHRVKALGLDKNNVLTRVIRSVSVSLSMFICGWRHISKGDRIFIVTNPPFIVPIFALLSKFKHSELVVLVHDVFPENLIPAKILKSEKSLLFKILKKIFDASYRKANKTIVLGADMLEVMQKKIGFDKPIKIIENWANTQAITPQSFIGNSLVEKYNLQHKYVVSFAGNLGRVQNLEFVLRIANKISNPRVHFLLIGSGALETTLKQYALNNKLDNVTFVGNLPRSEEINFLNAAHFGLVTLSPQLFGLGVPSKSYNIMAAGTPILFIGNKRSEIARMIHQYNCGYAFDEADEPHMLEFFNDLDESKLRQAKQKGEIARTLSETLYSKQNILKKFVSIFNEE